MFNFFRRRTVKNRFPLVVVGQIKEINKHPQADRLSLVLVDVGDRTLSIVCGADNIAIDQFVPVATIGAQLPNNLVIKQAELRGYLSEGMLCSAKELGLGRDHLGIMILDSDLVQRVGQSLDSYLSNN